MQSLASGKPRLAETRPDRLYRSDRGSFGSPAGSGTALGLRVAWRTLLLAALVLVTFPPCFVAMDTGGLDSSWAIGINELVNRHMTFGRDVIFTYGPLGFVITPRNLGSNMAHAVVFRLALHLLWWTAAGFLLFRIRATPPRCFSWPVLP